METMIAGTLVNVMIYRNGRLAEILRRPADGAAFVQAEVGDQMKIRLSQAGGYGRLEAYVSVDGRSVHRNVPADYLADRGLVFTGTTTFEGYRLDQQNVSPFTVTYREKSVAAWTTGDASNAGSIGVAIFREKEVVRPMGHLGFESYSGDTLRGEAKSPVGMTGQGRKHSAVGTTSFDRATYQPQQITVIQYRPMWWLVRHGIVKAQSNDPNPFPGNPGNTGYDFLR